MERANENHVMTPKSEQNTQRPTCGNCGKAMTPENSSRAPELFLCDECARCHQFAPQSEQNTQRSMLTAGYGGEDPIALPVQDFPQTEAVDVRDGNWMDKWGACRVCDGEIPHGHSERCDIYKMEQRIAVLEKALAAQQEQTEAGDVEKIVNAIQSDRRFSFYYTIHSFSEVNTFLREHLAPLTQRIGILEKALAATKRGERMTTQSEQNTQPKLKMQWCAYCNGWLEHGTWQHESKHPSPQTEATDTEINKIMAQCRRGFPASMIDESNSLHAECYGTISRLHHRVKELEAKLAGALKVTTENTIQHMTGKV